MEEIVTILGDILQRNVTSEDIELYKALLVKTLKEYSQAETAVKHVNFAFIALKEQADEIERAKSV